MYKLKKPIFIKENIIRPMFNEEFAKELVCIAEWFGTYSDDLQLVKAVKNVVSELAEINSYLLQNCNGYVFPYSNPTYELINVYARTYIGCCSDEKIIISDKANRELFLLYRTLNRMTYGLGEKYEEEIKKVMFLYTFIFEIYDHNDMDNK